MPKKSKKKKLNSLPLNRQPDNVDKSAVASPNSEDIDQPLTENDVEVETESKQKIAVFPGSFDPFTLGHLDIVKRAAKLFDEVIIAVGVSNSKTYLLDLDQRVESAMSETSALKNVSVVYNYALTVDIAKKVGANYLVRALRSSTDFDYEKPIAEANSKLKKDIETVFLIARPELACVSSSLVKEIAKSGGQLNQFVSNEVSKLVKQASRNL